MEPLTLILIGLGLAALAKRRAPAPSGAGPVFASLPSDLQQVALFVFQHQGADASSSLELIAQNVQALASSPFSGDQSELSSLRASVGQQRILTYDPEAPDGPFVSIWWQPAPAEPPPGFHWELASIGTMQVGVRGDPSWILVRDGSHAPMAL